MSGAAMEKVLDVFVSGRAKTKGSLDFKGRGRVVENVSGSKAWRQMMAHMLAQEWSRRERASATSQTGVRAALSGPVRVTATFYLPAPRGLASLITKGSGDIDKLTRNLLDALTDSGVIVDDSQVVGIICDKMAALDSSGPHGHRPGARTQGVHVQVWELG